MLKKKKEEKTAIHFICIKKKIYFKNGKNWWKEISERLTKGKYLPTWYQELNAKAPKARLVSYL